MNFLTKAKLYSRIGWGYTKPFRSFMRYPLLPMTWPIKKMASLGYKGLSKGVEGIEWTSHAVREGAKGVFKMGVSPFAMLAKSRLVTVKRFLWDVPIATASAALRTPIAIAKSPLEMVKGVRDAVTSVPGNVKEVFNSVRHLQFADAARNTRKLVSDLVLPPVTRPIAPILSPGANVIGKAAGAELQTLTTLKQAVTETVPDGARRFWNAPHTASSIMAQVQAKRAMEKAALAADRAKKEEAWQAEVSKATGEPEVKDKAA
jgi:hypothetical protein